MRWVWDEKKKRSNKPTVPLALVRARLKEPFAHLPTALRPAGRADRYNSGFLQPEKKLTFLPVLRYESALKKRGFNNPFQKLSSLIINREELRNDPIFR